MFKVSSARLPIYNSDSLDELPFLSQTKTRVYPFKDWSYRPRYVEGGVGSLTTWKFVTYSAGLWDNNIESQKLFNANDASRFTGAGNDFRHSFG